MGSAVPWGSCDRGIGGRTGEIRRIGAGRARGHDSGATRGCAVPRDGCAAAAQRLRRKVPGRYCTNPHPPPDGRRDEGAPPHLGTIGPWPTRDRGGMLGEC